MKYMSAAEFYAIMTCATGVMLLLGWLYVTADNPQSIRMLLKSVFLFILPTIGLAAVSAAFVRFPLSLWVGTLIEELLKAAAARSERIQLNRFFIITLFGIWEMILVKPLWGLSHADMLKDNNNIQLLGLTIAGTITVFMHTTTAEIYAFHFRGRLWLALVASWMLHTTFDGITNLFGVALIPSSLQLMALLILFAALWPAGRPTSPAQNR